MFTSNEICLKPLKKYLVPTSPTSQSIILKLPYENTMAELRAFVESFVENKIQAPNQFQIDSLVLDFRFHDLWDALKTDTIIYEDLKNFYEFDYYQFEQQFSALIQQVLECKTVEMHLEGLSEQNDLHSMVLNIFLRCICELKSLQNFKLLQDSSKAMNFWYEGCYHSGWSYYKYNYEFHLDEEKHLIPISIILHKFQLQCLEIDLNGLVDTDPKENKSINIFFDALAYQFTHMRQIKRFYLQIYNPNYQNSHLMTLAQCLSSLQYCAPNLQELQISLCYWQQLDNLLDCTKELARALSWLQSYDQLQVLEINLGYTGSVNSQSYISMEFYQTIAAIIKANPLKIFKFHCSGNDNYRQVINLQGQFEVLSAVAKHPTLEQLYFEAINFMSSNNDLDPNHAYLKQQLQRACAATLTAEQLQKLSLNFFQDKYAKGDRKQQEIFCLEQVQAILRSPQFQSAQKLHTLYLCTSTLKFSELQIGQLLCDLMYAVENKLLREISLYLRVADDNQQNLSQPMHSHQMFGLIARHKEAQKNYISTLCAAMRFYSSDSKDCSKKALFRRELVWDILEQCFIPETPADFERSYACRQINKQFRLALE